MEHSQLRGLTLTQQDNMQGVQLPVLGMDEETLIITDNDGSAGLCNLIINP